MYTFRGRPERTLGGRRCCLFSKRQSDRKARPLIHSSPADCFEKRPRRNAAFSVAKLKESITPVHLVRPSLVRVHCYEHTHTGCKSGVPREKKSSRLLRKALCYARVPKSHHPTHGRLPSCAAFFACFAAKSRTRCSNPLGISRFLSPALFAGW